jgi:methylenetetrahydrofolate reductase (NADPH)
LGVAFNPYEPPEHEFAKMKRKIEAGATFIITQPIIEQNTQVDRLLVEYPDIPVTIEAWMSKKLSLLSDAIGYEIPVDMEYDPIATLKMLHQIYPQCGVYLSLVGFKTQYDLVKDVWK